MRIYNFNQGKNNFFNIFVVEDQSTVDSHFVSLEKWLPAFQNTTVFAVSGRSLWTQKMKAIGTSEISVTI